MWKMVCDKERWCVTRWYVCMYECMNEWMNERTNECMYQWMYVCMHVCMYACMHVCMHVCMYACMDVCMHACMHVCISQDLRFHWEPSAPPDAVIFTPATQSGGPCRQAPRLPRKVKADVAKCHACHAKWSGDRGVHWEPSAPPDAVTVTPATQSGSPCRQVPRLPCKVKADVAKCHACHAKWSGDRGVHWEPSAPPDAVTVTPATQSGSPCRQVPRLPRKVKADVAKCHACHAKWSGDRGVHWEPSAPPDAVIVAPATLKVRVHVAKCHEMSPSATLATQTGAATAASTGNQARHQMP